MLKALGDGDISKEVFDEALEEGEGDDSFPTGEPGSESKPEEKPAQEAPASEAPATPPTPQIDLEEERKALAAQNEAYLQEMQKFMKKEIGALKQSGQEQQLGDEEDPVVKLERQYKEVSENLERLQKQAEEDQARRARESFDSAVSKLTEKYSDLDEYVAKEDRERAFKQALAAKQYGVKWEDAIVQTYKLNSFDKKISAAKQDDLSQKREEKRQQSLQAASAVSPGGSQFQPPVQKLDPRSKTFESDRRKAVMRELGVG
jgi:hypothetical protein